MLVMPGYEASTLQGKATPINVDDATQKSAILNLQSAINSLWWKTLTLLYLYSM